MTLDRFDLVGLFPSDAVEVVTVLQVEPKLGGGAEIAGQLQGHFGGDAPFAVDQLVDGTKGCVQVSGQSALGNP